MQPRVFVSSTFTDLKVHRAAVREVIQKLGATDVSMETLGARDERPLKECIRLIKKQSHFFVGIYAHRYGFMPAGSSTSVTEAEYMAATEVSLKRLIFVVNEDTAWPPKLIDQGESQEKLKRFIAQLKADHICEQFDDPKDLAARVASSVGRELSLRKLRKVSGEQSDRGKNKVPANPRTPKQWTTHRNGIYAESRGIFLAHTLAATRKKGQQFDISIFLLRHKPQNADVFYDVSHAEFFLGQYWGDKVFRVVNSGDLIGLTTSAYGTFLCTCKLHFTDNTSSLIYRYIDFEAARTAR